MKKKLKMDDFLLIKLELNVLDMAKMADIYFRRT